MVVALSILRRQSADTLAADRDIRTGLPPGFYPFGAQATWRYFLREFEVPMAAADSPDALRLPQTGKTALLHWSQENHKLEIQDFESLRR